MLYSETWEVQLYVPTHRHTQTGTRRAGAVLAVRAACVLRGGGVGDESRARVTVRQPESASLYGWRKVYDAHRISSSVMFSPSYVPSRASVGVYGMWMSDRVESE